MCYNCGCGIAGDDMGNPDNITEVTFGHLAKHWNKSVEETKTEVLKMLNENKADSDPHLKEMFEKAAKSWGQTVEEAKENTRTLLKDSQQ